MEIKISLRAARVNAGLTQAEAAKRLGAAKKTLTQYERGEIAPRTEFVKRAAEAYGIPPEMIRMEEGQTGRKGRK